MRIGAIDSGSARIGFVCADLGPPPLRLLRAPLTVNVGRMVPREVPKVYTRKSDGVTVTLTERREVTADDERRAAADLLVAISEVLPGELIIESVRSIHFAKDLNLSGAAGQATENLRAERIATRVAAIAESQGIRVTFVPAVSVRARVAGSASATDQELAPHIAMGYVDWPESSTKDQRDAAAALLWRVLPPKERKNVARGKVVRRRSHARAIAPTEGPRKGYSEPASMARRLAQLAARDAAGCDCIGRHLRTCPLKGVYGAAEKILLALDTDQRETRMPPDEFARTLDARRNAIARYGAAAWSLQVPARRDAVARVRAVDPSFPVTTPFELCLVCQYPATCEGERLPATPITCSCSRPPDIAPDVALADIVEAARESVAAE